MSALRYRLVSPAHTLEEHAKLCPRTAVGRYTTGSPDGELIIFECARCGFLSHPYVLVLRKEKDA